VRTLDGLRRAPLEDLDEGPILGPQHQRDTTKRSSGRAAATSTASDEHACPFED
jgi:hypothetical protein